MKSLRESLVFELHSSTYANAHDKEIERAGKETNRSRRFAVAAGKALTDELKKKGLIDKKTGKIKSDKTVEALPVIAKAASTNPTIKKAIAQDPESAKNLMKTSRQEITLHVPGFITEEGDYHKSFDIKLPNAKYVLYNDKYRNALHLADMPELFTRIGFFESLDDFEAFTPKDIVYTSDDPIEIITYAVDEYGDWRNDIIKDLGTCDDVDWAQRVLDEDEDFNTADYNMGLEESMLCYVDTLVDDNGNVYGGYDLDGPEYHTENYKDYIKRVFNK